MYEPHLDFSFNLWFLETRLHENSTADILNVQGWALHYLMQLVEKVCRIKTVQKSTGISTHHQAEYLV